MIEENKQQSERRKSCVNCGAELTFKPGTTSINCNYCGHQEAIQLEEAGFKELELKPFLDALGNQSHSEEISMLQCKSCGANQHIEENYKSLHCVFCNSPLIIEDAVQEEWILPGAVLPFQINQNKSFIIFKTWVNSLWFAPNKLKKAALDPQFTKGLYVPYWTFDAQLYAEYSGLRGEYYYETVRYTDSKGNSQTRQEQRTNWYPASGTVSGFVDDTLVAASQQKKGVIPSKVTRWDLKKLQPFSSSFLSGFVTEKYTIPLKEGHLSSKEEANKIAHRWSRQDIGGDTQQIHDLSMQLTDETFKHILLPIYISTYVFNSKNYQFFINGDSGAISGKRPYSFWKIFFLVLFILIIGFGIYWVT